MEDWHVNAISLVQTTTAFQLLLPLGLSLVSGFHIGVWLLNFWGCLILCCDIHSSIYSQKVLQNKKPAKCWIHLIQK